jgi:hypothetical protein
VVVAAGLGVGPQRVHHPQCARLLRVRVLSGTELLARVVGIRERIGRVQHAPVGVGVQQEGTELVSEPERPVVCALHRLDVEVGAGQDSLRAEVIDDGERDLVARVVQLDVAQHRDRPRAALRRLEIRLDEVHAKLEVRRVLDRAVAVVRHDPVAAPAGGQCGRESLHRLACEWNRHAVDGRRAEQRA